MKVITTYQQGFVNHTASPDAVFRFQRVYKTSPTHKLRITVSSLSFETLNNGSDFTPLYFYLSGIAEFSGKCINLSESGTMNNNWGLGQCGENSTENNKSGTVVASPPSLIVDDIPLTPFRISLEDLSGQVSTDCKFRVTFNIDVIDV